MQLITGGAALFLLVAIFAIGYFTAQNLTRMQSLATIQAYKQRVSTEHNNAQSAKKHAKKSIAALSGRVGELKAHIIRLNALGRELVKIIGLDPKEFNFNNPPAEGGPEIDLPQGHGNSPPLLDQLNSVTRSIKGLDQQLSVLENILMHRNLSQEMHPSGRPINGGWISSYYGNRVDPITGRMGFHPGIDFADRKGTPVHAIASGIVTWAGSWYGYGNLVEIDNGHGYATRYGHNEKILVKVGQAVSKGEVISLMGSTGHSTGPHVHLEVLYHGQRVDPLKFVKGNG